MHLYNCISVVLLVPRLNLAFLSPKLSRGIDIVLVCLYPLDSIAVGIILGECYYNWHIRLWIILFGLRTTNSTSSRPAYDRIAQLKQKVRRGKITDHIRVKIRKNRHRTEAQFYKHNCIHRVRHDEHVAPPELTP
jgi:hypothetical protein